MTRMVLVSVLLVGLGAAPSAQVRPRVATQPSPRFLSLWSMYRRGDADAAVEAFARWKAKDVAAEAALPSADADPWARVALATFHTEAGFRNNTFGRWAQGTPTEIVLGGWGLADVYEVHSYRAFLLVKEVTEIARRTHDDRLLSFVRSWYITTMSYCLRWRLPDTLRDLWDIVDHEFGDEPEIRLLIGSVAEARAQPRAVGGIVSPGIFRGPHGGVRMAGSGPAGGPGAGQEAIFEYRHALKDAPGLFEARLRLGRMLHLIGREEEATKELTRALADAQAARQTFSTYVAGLFLGEIDEEVGHDLKAAIAHYRAAVEAYPYAHYGRLALGQALVRSGNEEGWLEARKMFDGEGAQPAVVDPYGIYQYGQYWQIVPRLREMRGEIRP